MEFLFSLSFSLLAFVLGEVGTRARQPHAEESALRIFSLPIVIAGSSFRFVLSFFWGNDMYGDG